MFRDYEEKWRKWWAEHPEIYGTQEPITKFQETNNNQLPHSKKQTKPKKYVLVEFPYPSGSGLHVGHAFTFTGGDVYARFKRMQGYNVMFPMGWDAFGLPTENYAIKMKRKPQEVTKENTDMFRIQMKRLAFSFDWSREVNTTDPDYYKWTQWIFTQLFKKGLAYKQEMPINWCPSCKVGLANEEVLPAGRQGLMNVCERCGAEVSRRNISQWIVKITDYADRLIDGLKETDFIEKVKKAQINWIGKSEGATIKFQISNFKFQNENKSYLEVFTTRPDTIYGATFMVISPEHKLIGDVIARSEATKQSQQKIATDSLNPPDDIVELIKEYVKLARKKSDMERTELNKDKTGVFSGLYAINPANNKEIPIWISDFVLASYGTGAIMSVPAHDKRDEEFAKKYKLPIVEVVNDQGIMINSLDLNGLKFNDASQKIIVWLKDKGIGESKNSYHLRDWIFSRQHYWGEPIPMIFCFKDGWVTVPEEELPIRLPEVEAYEPTDDGQSPLSTIEEFVKCKCPVCGGVARRETDTMPNWAGSDWYYLAYCFANKINKQSPITKIQTMTNDQLHKDQTDSKDIDGDIFSDSNEEMKYWLPVDVYIGGDEHNTLHMLYSRFIHQFLYDLGVVPTPEPYHRRMSHGVILDANNNRMSKSKGNVIVPEVVADKYGVDVIRMYLMFIGPFEGTMAWDEKTLMGVKRFLDRFEIFIVKHINNVTVSNDKNRLLINKCVKEVGEDIESFGFNTAIAKQMKLLNSLDSATTEEMKTMVLLIAPFAPYLAEELWASFAKVTEGQVEKNYESVHQQEWPKYDEKLLVTDSVVVAVAVNGKVRDELKISNDQLLTSNEIIKNAKELKKVRQWIEGKEMVKEIYVPGKMINLVIK